MFTEHVGELPSIVEEVRFQLDGRYTQLALLHDLQSHSAHFFITGDNIFKHMGCAITASSIDFSHFTTGSAELG